MKFQDFVKERILTKEDVEARRKYEGRYRGASIWLSSDYEFHDIQVMAYLHGTKIYEGSLTSFMSPIDGDVRCAMVTVDKAIEAEGIPYATEKEFVGRIYGDEAKIGFFCIDEDYIPAAASKLEDGSYLYGQITESDFERLMLRDENCISEKGKKVIVNKEERKAIEREIIELSKKNYLLGGHGSNSRDRITIDMCRMEE